MVCGKAGGIIAEGIHECIHFEWHYMLLRLQNMHNNDIHQLKKVRRATIKDQDAADPTEFMEQHAQLGSYGLMMPVTFMRETIDKMYKDKSRITAKNPKSLLNYIHLHSKGSMITKDLL